MKKALLVISIVLIVSCNHSRNDEKLLKQIEGNWINDENYFSFTDSIITKFSIKDSCESYSYYIDSDTLKSSSNIVPKIKYWIYYSTNDTLKLYKIHGGIKEKIVLYKSLPKMKDKIFLDSLSYLTSFCYGDCPFFILKIFDNKQISYQGFIYVDSVGDYIGKLTNNQYQIVERLLSAINSDELPNDNLRALDIVHKKMKIIFHESNKQSIVIYNAYWTIPTNNPSKELRLLSNWFDYNYTKFYRSRISKFKVQKIFSYYPMYYNKAFN